MTDDDFARVRAEIRDRLAREALAKLRGMARKRRAKCRDSRLAKEFRLLKSLLLAEERRPGGLFDLDEPRRRRRRSGRDGG